jgi:predicted protein tyrosine phosphatase
MEVFVYSRAAIEALPPHDVPHVIVSITSYVDDRARIRVSEQCREIVRLTFRDVLIGDGVFSAVDAQTIWEALERHRDIVRVVVHCDAGISRSAGVAAAILKAHGGDDAPLFQRYRPNPHVYETMLACAPETVTA